MRALIDTTYAQRAPNSGTAVYLRQLMSALRSTGCADFVTHPNPHRPPPAGGGAGSVRNLAIDIRWQAVQLPRAARRVAADVVHHPLPAWAATSATPQVVTVADLAFERLPHLFAAGFRRYAHHAHRFATRRADMVICISQTTADDACELWGLDPERVVVAPLGPGQDLPAPAGAPSGPGYFLYVGDAEPRKDLGTLLRAHELYRATAPDPVELVLAGSTDAAQAPGVRVVGAPDAPALANLYAGALALVHPSRYEGFGLTPVEAMKSGVPVIAARSPGVAEVCAGAAWFAEPGQAESFSEAMSRLAADAELRGVLAERGRQRAAEFSWAECARRHCEAYLRASQGGLT